MIVMFVSLSLSYLDHARFDGMSLYVFTAQHVIKLLKETVLRNEKYDI